MNTMKTPLQNIYELILKNYRTELSDADFRKVTTALNEFVTIGGKFELK